MALIWNDFLWSVTRWATAQRLVKLSSSQLIKQFEIDIGPPFFRSGRFQVTVADICQIGSPIRISQAAGPYTGKGTRADEAEMDSVNITGYALNKNTLQCYWTSTGPVAGHFKFNYISRLA